MLTSANDKERRRAGAKSLEEASWLSSYKAPLAQPLTQEPGQRPHSLVCPDPSADRQVRRAAAICASAQTRKPFFASPPSSALTSGRLYALSTPPPSHLLNRGLFSSQVTLLSLSDQLLTGFLASSLALVPIHFPHGSHSSFF